MGSGLFKEVSDEVLKSKKVYMETLDLPNMEKNYGANLQKVKWKNMQAI